MIKVLFAIVLFSIIGAAAVNNEKSWIRINQLGYMPQSKKVAVWCSKESKTITSFQLIDSATKKSKMPNTRVNINNQPFFCLRRFITL